MIVPLLDTHIWLWWLLDDPALKKAEKEFLSSLPAEKRPYLSDISLWELGMLIQKNRFILNCPLDEFLSLAVHSSAVRLLLIQPATIVQMNLLPASFHQDPADRLIIATSRALQIPLWTQDKLIRKSKLTEVFECPVFS